MDKKELILACQKFDGAPSPADFSKIFAAYCDLENPSGADIAREFSANATTARRWRAGQSAPAAGYQKLVVNKILALLSP